MTRLPARFVEDRVLRDKARAVLSDDLARLQGNLEEEGIASRVSSGVTSTISSRIKTGARDVLAVATLVEAHGPAPVMLRTFTGVESDCGAESVGELVGMWVELLESGRYHVEDGSLQPVDPMYTEEPRLLWVL